MSANFKTFGNYLQGAPIVYPTSGSSRPVVPLAVISGYGGIGYSTPSMNSGKLNYNTLSQAYKQNGVLFGGPYSARMCLGNTCN